MGLLEWCGRRSGGLSKLAGMDKAPALAHATPSASIRTEITPALAQPIGGGLSPTLQFLALPMSASYCVKSPDGLAPAHMGGDQQTLRQQDH